MRLLAKYGIGVRLALVFGILIIVSAAAGLYGTFLSQSLSHQRATINQANYTSNNAIRDIRTSIFRMHRSMKDAAMSRIPGEAEAALTNVAEDDRLVILNLNKLQLSYHGDPIYLNNLRDDFVAWRAIRQRVATLQDEGREPEAIAITRAEGADHVEKLDHEVRELLEATAAAHARSESSINIQQRRMSRSMAGVLLGAALLTLSTGLHTGYRLVQPLRVLVQFADEIRSGKLDRRLKLHRNDEIGTLASALDAMADSIETNQFALIANQKDLEQRVNERTAELTAAHNELDLEFQVREKITNRLKQSEERLELMVTGANDGFWDWPDVHSPELWWSPRVFAITGLDPRTFKPDMTSAMALCHPDDRKRIVASMDPRNNTSGSVDEEFRIIDSENNTVWIHMRGRVFRDRQGSPVRMSGSFRDITKNKWAEAQLKEKNLELASLNKRLQANQNQLIQAEKMSSLGQLAAGVAHEINNPVGFITSNLGTMGQYTASLKKLINPLLAANSDAKSAWTTEETQQQVALAMQEEDFGFLLEDVDQIVTECLEGTERISAIVQGLKSFARPDEDTLSTAQINDGLESALHMVWSTVKYKCEVEKDLGDIPPIYCNIGRLNQVFMNLIVNASHAIEKNGNVSLRTRHEDGHIVVEISDDGSGISPESLRRIFEPFYTTKPVGKGTGLGLSISHGIIEDHHGTITVQSEVGQGTTFTLRIPDNLDAIKEQDVPQETVTT